MIPDKNIKQFCKNAQNFLAESTNPVQAVNAQFQRGVESTSWEGQHPNGCKRHSQVFSKYNIIPKYCFNCYKVLIEPHTIVELFKLMVIFEKLKLPKDNTRKCTVETREQVSGAYKGFIYCRGTTEATEISKFIKKVISEEISSTIPVTLKRGCTEYAIAYPEYAQVEQNSKTMWYKDEWHEYEELFDKDMGVNARLPTNESYNRPGYTLQDAQIVLAWLRYAATIGDLSYLKITDSPLQPFQKPFQNLKRPPFHDPEKNV